MKTTKIKKSLEPEQITALIDTREQIPLTLSPLKTKKMTLTTGDYSVEGLENLIAVERKSLQDLIMCCGRERERFDKEIIRLLAYPVRAVFCEGSYHEIAFKNYRGELQPQQVMGSILGWIAHGVPIVMCETRENCDLMVARFLFIAARRRYIENYNFLESVS